MRIAIRGWGMLLAGAALAVVAAAMQSITTARIAAVLAAIPVVVGVWASATRVLSRPPRLQRDLGASRWQVDSQTQVHLTRTRALPPWSTITERVPTSLRRQSTGPFSYTVRPARRGPVEVGPTVLHRRDPLAIASWRTEIAPVQSVLVRPRTETVDQEVLTRALDATAPRPHGLPQHSVEDLTLREYRHGDGLHRVHWRSSARHGELMVRHDEPTTTRVLDLVLLLSENEDEVAEWAVVAAASVGRALVGAGYTLRVVTVADDLIDVPTAQVGDMLDAFAIAGPAGEAAETVMHRLARSTSAGTVMVLDRPVSSWTSSIVAAAGHQGVALVVDPDADASGLLEAMPQAGWLVARSEGSGPIAPAWAPLAGVR